MREGQFLFLTPPTPALSLKGGGRAFSWDGACRHGIRIGCKHPHTRAQPENGGEKASALGRMDLWAGFVGVFQWHPLTSSYPSPLRVRVRGASQPIGLSRCMSAHSRLAPSRAEVI